MPSLRRSTLTMPERAAVVLVPLDHERPGMVAGSSGTTASSRPWQITMPPECWPRWRGRSWMADQSAAKTCMRGCARIAAGGGEMREQGVAGILELEVRHESAQPLDEVGRQAQHLADLARGEPAAVGDHVGGHGGAEAPVALVDVLDHPLAAVAAGQVEVDVRPLAALLGEEALEEQLHAHRIHGGDAERVADGAVRRRAPPLHEDALDAAELDDVPDDEEIAGEVELADELQLARDLLPRLLRELAPPVARPPPFLGQVAEEADAASAPAAAGSRESGSRDA